MNHIVPVMGARGHGRESERDAHSFSVRSEKVIAGSRRAWRAREGEKRFWQVRRDEMRVVTEGGFEARPPHAGGVVAETRARGAQSRARRRARPGGARGLVEALAESGAGWRALPAGASGREARGSGRRARRAARRSARRPALYGAREAEAAGRAHTVAPSALHGSSGAGLPGSAQASVDLSPSLDMKKSSLI